MSPTIMLSNVLPDRKTSIFPLFKKEKIQVEVWENESKNSVTA